MLQKIRMHKKKRCEMIRNIPTRLLAAQREETQDRKNRSEWLEVEPYVLKLNFIIQCLDESDINL